MASSSKRKQTMAKVARERALQERRERKQEKKDERKRAAAELSEGAAEPVDETNTDVPSSSDGSE
jgi:hypothetical protein